MDESQLQAARAADLPDVAVMGVGSMGSALARALHGGGARTMVWNRTPSRCAPLQQEGIAVADTAEAAMSSCAVTIFSLGVTTDIVPIVSAAAETADLTGRIVVNLTTGTPAEAVVVQEAATAAGIRYLHGTISVFPGNIGHDVALIHYAGDAEAWKAAEPALNLLAPRGTVYVGDDVKKPAILDVAVTGGVMATGLFGFIEGAVFAASYGVAPAELLEGARNMVRLLELKIADAVAEMSLGAYPGSDATLDTWTVGTSEWSESMVARGLPGHLMSAMKQWVDEAVAAGYGRASLPGLFEHEEKAREARIRRDA